MFVCGTRSFAARFNSHAPNHTHSHSDREAATTLEPPTAEQLLDTDVCDSITVQDEEEEEDDEHQKRTMPVVTLRSFAEMPIGSADMLGNALLGLGFYVACLTLGYLFLF